MDRMARALIAGNWKMNGLKAEGLALARAIRAGAAGIGADLLICPPASLLSSVGDLLAGSPIALGGQDCHPDRPGAHTGDIAMTGVLEDLERVMMDIAHAPSPISAPELEKMRRRLEAEDILFKIRVLGSNVRNCEHRNCEEG